MMALLSFWRKYSCLTFRRSRPPTAAAELRALGPHNPHRPSSWFIHRHSPSQTVFCWGLGRSPGFACKSVESFKPFWPSAPVQRAQAATPLVAFRAGAVPLHRPSGLTRQSSRPAYGERLTLSVIRLDQWSSIVTPRKHYGGLPEIEFPNLSRRSVGPITQCLTRASPVEQPKRGT